MPVHLSRMLALLLAILASAYGAQLLPDGLLRTTQGLSGALDAGVSHWSGSAGQLSLLAGRGTYAYQPNWMVGGGMEVMSSRPADSSLFSSSKIGLLVHGVLGDTAGASGVATAELSWWTQSIYRDTGSKAIEQINSGVELLIGVGLGSLGWRRFQSAWGVHAALRLPVEGESTGELEPLLGGDIAFLWDLEGLWPGVGTQRRNLGVYARIPVEWSLLRPDPSTATLRVFSAPQWTVSVHAGLTISL